MIDNAEILSIVKLKIGNQLTIADNYLTSLIEEMKQEIRNYCNIKIVPKELKYTCANMVTDYALRFSPEAIAAAQSGEGQIDANNTLTGVSLGGISANLGSSDASSIINDANKRATKGLTDFVKNYKSRLQPFRRVRW